MFNLLNFFKKKPAEPIVSETVAPAPEKPIQIDDIVIHTMPERFRHQSQKTDSAKTAGLLIIGGGAVFLTLVSAFLYFYLFKQPAVTVKMDQPVLETKPSIPTSEVSPVISQEQTNSATSTLTTTEKPTLPVDNVVATSTATSTPEVVEKELPIGLLPSLDSDTDGLTNAEEILLGTSTSTPDTDGDGYLDGAETLSLYDPASTTKLIDNPNIVLYQNKTFNYSVLYPKAFELSVNGGDDSIMFKSLDNQFLQIIVQANTAKQSLDQWYMDQLDVTDIKDLNRLSGSNWQGIKNLDGLTVYLMDSKQNYIFTLSYNPGENNILDYINIFNMMVKSFSQSNN